MILYFETLLGGETVSDSKIGPIKNATINLKFFATSVFLDSSCDVVRQLISLFISTFSSLFLSQLLHVVLSYPMSK